MDRKYGKILGINVSSTSNAKVLAFVRSSLINKRKFYIVTPNPEIVLAAQKDKKLAEIINNSTLAIADGVGLSQAAKFLSMPSPKNIILRFPICFFQGLWVGLATFFDKKWLFEELRPIKGRELFIELVRLANKKHWKIYLLGGKSKEAEFAAKRLRVNYKGIKIDYSNGPILDITGKPINNFEREKEKETLKKINGYSPELLFVGFGAPKQEKWLYRWLSKLNIGGGMVVGGLSYVSGAGRLPPKWMEESGLEWIWRLLTQPQRIRRILNAWPIFPLTVFWYKVNIKQA